MSGQSEEQQTGRSVANQRGTFSTTAEIPSFLEPFLRSAADTGQSSLERLRRLSQGDLVADFNADQLRSFDLARSIAEGGGGFIPESLDALLSTARGDFLFGGDGFNAALGAAENRIIPDVISRFGGRGGSTLASAAAAQNIGDSFASLFNQERGRQLNAAQILPGLSLLPSDILSQIGGLQQAQAQREIDAPLQAQSNLFALSSGSIPFGSLIGQETNTRRNTTGREFATLHSNPASGFLGGGLAGLGLGASTAAPGATGLAALGGPLGIGLGIGGGLLGAFS